jgi:hypothetical protein
LTDSIGVSGDGQTHPLAVTRDGIFPIGSAGEAIINTIFMDHFQDMARGHFLIRKHERKLGKKVIERLNAEIP